MITWMWSGCYLNYSPLTGPIILYHSDSGDQGASRRPVGAGRWRPQHADAAESVSSIRHCRPRNAPPSPQGIIRHRRCSFELVPVVPQSLHSTCSLWQLDIISIISYVWSTTPILFLLYTADLPGFDLHRRQWSLLNRFRTGQGHCNACHKKWGFTDNELCDCGEIQTVSHIVNFCPLTKFDGGLLRLHEADEAAVDWLTTYGS